MSVAEKTRVDYGACENKLRDVLRLSEEQGDNMLADYVSTMAKTELLLKSPKACYETTNHKGEVVAKRKPCWGQWATTTSATATRRGGGNGIPMCDKDFEKAAYVHAINALPAPYPDMLRGRFAPDPEIDQMRKISAPIIASYRELAPMTRAGEMLAYILRPWDYSVGPKPKICEVCGISKGDWPDSKERKAWDEVNRKLRAQMKPALDAWMGECLARGLEL